MRRVVSITPVCGNLKLTNLREEVDLIFNNDSELDMWEKQYINTINSSSDVHVTELDLTIISKEGYGSNCSKTTSNCKA